MGKHSVTLIMGDGIGPEIGQAMKRCVDATGVSIDWSIVDAGEKVMEKYGTPLPKHVLDTIKKTKVAIKTPITTPVGEGFRSVNVELRKKLDLFSNVRPAKTYTGVQSRFDAVDLVIFRENTDDLYVGIEFEKGKKKTKDLIKKLNKIADGDDIIRDDSGISIKPISVFKTKRIVEAAFAYARANKRKKVTCVHKANIMKYTDGLFLKTFQQVAKKYPDIASEDKIVDNMCMQLVQKPELYDVLVCPNLYGDIISDLAAGLVGGLGVAPGANIGKKYAVFEAVHGSAPKYAGMNKANPTAMILSAVLMLRYLEEFKAADKLENALASIIAEGKYVTYDLLSKEQQNRAVGTKEMADAIIKRLK